MSERTFVEPGSPLSLKLFHAWCRACITSTYLQGRAPALLFADSPTQEVPVIAEWDVEGEMPERADFLSDLIVDWVNTTQASQIGIGIPFAGDVLGVLLLTVDETGHVAEQAQADEHGLSGWRPLPRGGLPFGDWQRLLAKHAGYRDFTKWRCTRCESVCPGEADERPSPCDYCGSDEIEAVSTETPLAPPRPPYDKDYVSEELELLASPFVQTLVGLINGRRQG